MKKQEIKKLSKDFPKISVKNEDWKYTGKNVNTVNDFQTGKPSKIQKNEIFNIDSNCHEFVVNTKEKNIDVIDVDKITKSTIDESIKRPFDKFSIEQFEKLTGGFQLNFKDDCSDYYSINCIFILSNSEILILSFKGTSLLLFAFISEINNTVVSKFDLKPLW